MIITFFIQALLQSSFVRNRPASMMATRESSVLIHFTKAYTTCDRATGIVDISWVSDASPIEGLLGNEAFASGATKQVYKVCWTCFVKRFQ